MHILLVEDDQDLAEVLRMGLEQHGHSLDVIHDGLQAEAHAQKQSYDALIVDWMLPGQDGRTLIERLRAAGSRVPILMLTALDDDQHLIDGLDAGADDYVTKPFALKTLAARLRALARRGSLGSPDERLEVGALRLVPRRRDAHLHDRPIDLREKEYMLLDLLARHAGTVVSRTTLADEVWSDADEVNDTTINMTISTLRGKLREAEPKQAGSLHIETVRGVGYRLVVD